MITQSINRIMALLIATSTVASAQERNTNETARLQQMIGRFAPTEIKADVSKLSPTDRRVLAKLVEASKVIDALFLRQVWAGNDSMLLDLSRDETPEGRARLHYFLINKGTMVEARSRSAVHCRRSRQAGQRQFLSARCHEGRDRELDEVAPGSGACASATGFFTVIRRGNGSEV